MLLIRYAVGFVAGWVVLYAGLMVASYVAFPLSSGDAIDTASAATSLFATEPKYVFFEVDRLNRDVSRVIVIGASNARDGFRPLEIKKYVGNIEIDNLAIGSSNIAEIAETVDLIYSKLPPTSWKKTVFVVGVWYGDFASNARTWSDAGSTLDAEKLRYGFFRRDANGNFTVQIPDRLQPAAKWALRPLLLVSWLYETGVARSIDAARSALVAAAGEAQPPTVNDADRDTFQLTPALREVSLVYWRKLMGPASEWDSQGFPRILELARKISAHGSHLILVDLPIPSWHAAAIPQAAEYGRLRVRNWDVLRGISNVEYVALPPLDDRDYFDSVHPRPRATYSWAKEIAPAILRALNDDGRSGAIK